jgi:fumarylacetoacetate (FAA) hydrolase
VDFGKADAGVRHDLRLRDPDRPSGEDPVSVAGTIIGSGTVSNRDAGGGPGKPVAEGGLGYSCIAEVRTVETILRGAAETPFLTFGDTVRIEMLDDRHHSIFGAIEQTVEKA